MFAGLKLMRSEMNCLCVSILNLQNYFHILNYFKQISICSMFCLFIFIWSKKHMDAFSKECALLQLFMTKGGVIIAFQSLHSKILSCAFKYMNKAFV